jgi:hypothetical protein
MKETNDLFSQLAKRVSNQNSKVNVPIKIAKSWLRSQ